MYVVFKTPRVYHTHRPDAFEIRGLGVHEISDLHGEQTRLLGYYGITDKQATKQ
jgi:hypothetical protein